ncbi:hypothetical protein Hanom_Chr04g00325351 [Helianthus anomalus]
MRSFCSYMIPCGFFYHKTDKMGCVPSNSSGHPQPDTQVINPTHHFDAPSNTMENRASHLTLYGYGELPIQDATLPIQDTAGKKDSHDETGVKKQNRRYGKRRSSEDGKPEARDKKKPNRGYGKQRSSEGG